MLVAIDVAFAVVSHQFFGVDPLHGHHISQKIHKLSRMRLFGKEEIDSIRLCFHVDHLRLGIVLDDDLLQPQKRLLVGDVLPHLHARVPRILGFEILALSALLIGHGELYDKRLLQDGAGENFLLHRQLDLEPTRVRLRPHPRRIYQSNLAPQFHTLQARVRNDGRKEPKAPTLSNSPISSRLSGSHTTQWAGGLRKRLQPRHHGTLNCYGAKKEGKKRKKQLNLTLGMLSVISTSCETHAAHMAAGFPVIGTPHRQHKLLRRQ